MRFRYRFLLLPLATVSSLAMSPIVSAQDSGAGTAVIVDPIDRSRVLRSGDSNTEYRLRLPDGAACPGDSANDDFRVNSFIIPASEDPGSIRFRAIGPEGPNTDSKWALYTTAPNPYSQRLTLANGESGQPGRIDILPDMTFSLYPLETLPPGRYVMGIACSPGVEQTTSRYWSTEIEISHNASVDSGGLRWTVVDPSVSVNDSSGGGSGVWIALVTLVLAAGVYVMLRRPGRNQQSQYVKERT